MPRTLSEPEFDAIKAKILDAAPSGLKEDEFNRYIRPALAGAIGEAENSAEPITGSALGRFAAGAWKNLNPMGLVDVIAHPIDTAVAIGQSHLSQADKARQAFKEGRYSEALAHTAATALPVLGPVAANAGERIGTGDVAGGLGEAAGLVGAMESPRALRAVPAVGRAVAQVPIRAPAAAVLDAGAAVLDNPITGTLSPRLRNLGETIGKGADLIRPKTAPVSEAAPLGVETAQQQLQRMTRERWLRGPEPTSPAEAPTQAKSVAAAINEVAEIAKAEKVKVSLAQHIKASKLVGQGMAADAALAVVKLAEELPNNADVAEVVTTKNARNTPEIPKRPFVANQKLLNELALAARRAGVRLTPEAEQAAVALAGKGISVTEAIAQVTR